MRASLLLPLLLNSAAAFAAETITYTCDSRGRLVQVARTGSINNGVTTNYTIDKADNRTNKTTTGSPILRRPNPRALQNRFDHTSGGWGMHVFRAIRLVLGWLCALQFVLFICYYLEMACGFRGIFSWRHNSVYALFGVLPYL